MKSGDVEKFEILTQTEVMTRQVLRKMKVKYYRDGDAQINI